MRVDGDTAAAALSQTLQYLFTTFSSPWFEHQSGVVGGLTGVPIAMFNGIWAETVRPSPQTVAEMLDRVAASGLPYCAQLRPGAPSEVADDLLRRGMTQLEQVPLMVLEVSSRLEAAQRVEQLRIRPMPPEEAPLHTSIVADAFDIPEDLILQLMTPEALARAELHCYLGEIDGEPVTTGLGIGLGQFVGIFDVATRPDFRGRGFASALTARVAADAWAAGARWAWLQSSPTGYNIYEKLGFRTLERWDCWVKAS